MRRYGEVWGDMGRCGEHAHVVEVLGLGLGLRLGLGLGLGLGLAHVVEVIDLAREEALHVVHPARDRAQLVGEL